MKDELEKKLTSENWIPTKGESELKKTLDNLSPKYFPRKEKKLPIFKMFLFFLLIVFTALLVLGLFAGFVIYIKN